MLLELWNLTCVFFNEWNIGIRLLNSGVSILQIKIWFTIITLFIASRSSAETIKSLASLRQFIHCKKRQSATLVHIPSANRKSFFLHTHAYVYNLTVYSITFWLYVFNWYAKHFPSTNTERNKLSLNVVAIESHANIFDTFIIRTAVAV